MSLKDQTTLRIVLYEGHGAQPLENSDRFAGGPPQAEETNGQVNIHFQDIAGFDASRVAETVESIRAGTNAAKHGDWKPWFPVIDYDRCTNCMQCLSFCLFGVYGVDEQHRTQV